MDGTVMEAMNSRIEEEAKIMSEIEKYINRMVENMKDDGISFDDFGALERPRLMKLIEQLKHQRAETIGICNEVEMVFNGNWIGEIIRNFCPQTAKELQKESNESITSIMKAARHGNILNVQTFQKNGEREQLNPTPTKTIVLAILDGMLAEKYKENPGAVLQKNLIAGKGVRESIRDAFFPPYDTFQFPCETPDHYRCLEYVMKKIPQHQLDINFEDVNGNTALHYAITWQEMKATILLLQKGAYTCKPNKHGMMYLKSINSQILEEYLDSCITSNNYPPEHADYQVTINFGLFIPQKQKFDDEKQENIRESAPVLIMREDARFNKLLNHPVITSYLCLKWNKVRIFFYLNLMWYFLYWFLLNSHLYCFSRKVLLGESKNNSNETISPFLDKICDLPTSCSWQIFIVISCSTLVLRELIQIWNLPMRYIKSTENWMELCLFVTTFYFLCAAHSLHASSILASAMVLVSWLELMLLIGRHPQFSTHIEMFKTVSMNFFRYLFLYSIMIIAFGFSFYILFNDVKDKNNEYGVFRFINTSIFKSFFMIKSGFDFATIPLSELTTWAQVCLTIFTFSITIVLLNLLSGLAFEDTLRTQKAAKLIGIKSRLNFIAQVESTTVVHFLDIIDNLCQWFSCCFSRSGKRSRKYSERVIVEKSNSKLISAKQHSSSLLTNSIYRRIRLGHTLHDGKIKIFPNRQLPRQVICDHKAIEGAVDILKKKQSSKTREVDEFCKQILQEIKTKISSNIYPPPQVCAAN